TSTSENGYFAVGQEVAGETSGAVGIVTAIGSGNITVQIIPSDTGDAVYFDSLGPETVIGPTGSATVSNTGGVPPQAVTIWNDEVDELLSRLADVGILRSEPARFLQFPGGAIRHRLGGDRRQWGFLCRCRRGQRHVRARTEPLASAVRGTRRGGRGVRILRQPHLLHPDLG